MSQMWSAGQMPYFLGIDVGGTNLRAALFRPNSGELLPPCQAPTHSEEGPEAVLSRIAALARQAMNAAGVNSSELIAAGMGLPGRLVPRLGQVEFLPNLAGHWVGVQAGEILSGMLDMPVHLINDARAMTYAEWKYGAGRGLVSMACFTLGTGIGGGVVVNEQLLWDPDGTIGELGHQVVDADGLPCPCGGRGCLEVYASGTAIDQAGADAVRTGQATFLNQMAGGDAGLVNAEMVAEAAKRGDAAAVAIFERAGLYLGIAVSNVVVTVGPQRVVMGGGMARLGDLILEPVRRTLYERVHLTPVNHIKIVLAQLGPQAGLLGAAAWAENQTKPKGTNQ